MFPEYVWPLLVGFGLGWCSFGLLVARIGLPKDKTMAWVFVALLAINLINVFMLVSTY